MVRLYQMTLELTKILLKQASITPDDAGCQTVIADRLKKGGFDITHLRYGKVDNLWARKGSSEPLFVFVGHTDVVPTGDMNKWQFPPFEPTVHEGYLYGRGAQDMKSNIAAMIIAVEKFLHETPDFTGSIGFLITSDEEGPSIDGTVRVVEYLQSQQIKINYCIVGEPSSQNVVGDILKIGRRGSLSAELIIHGKQGHIAYPHLAINPIHHSVEVLKELIQKDWDDNQSEKNFDKTSFQISNIHAGTGAHNVIPDDLMLKCNFRYSPVVTEAQLKKEFEELLKKYNINHSINWLKSSLPFLTAQGKLLSACISAIEQYQKISPILSTTGGTSDGRFIAPTGAEVVELGLCNDTIHHINERVKISELDELTALYQKILSLIFIN
jgi:succinyl-diaminopimelate desuccinylase